MEGLLTGDLESGKYWAKGVYGENVAQMGLFLLLCHAIALDVILG
jgi:hypothetical protein